MQILVGSLFNAMVYAALAWTYVLAQSVTHRPNLAHGVVFAFSAQAMVLAAVQGYVVLWMATWSSILFGIAVSICFTCILMFAIARTIFPPLLIRAPNSMIVGSLGLALAITEAARIGSGSRDMWLAPLTLQRVTIPFFPGQPVIGLYPLAASAGLLALLLFCERLVQKSTFGRNIRAVTDDPLAARMSGVHSVQIVERVVFLSGLLTGMTGIVAVLHYGNMSFGSGLFFSLKVLFLASAGGFESPGKASAAGFGYGVAEAVWDGYMPTAWRDAVFFAILAAILILRPQNREKAV